VGFHFGKTKSNQRVFNLAKTEKWSSTVIFLWAKNSLTIVALWDGLSALESNSVEQNANKPSVFANLQPQSFSLCPCQCSNRLLAFLAKGGGFEVTIEKSSRHCCHYDTL
jgi:hypothetical protein